MTSAPTRADWIARSARLLDEARALLAPFGVTLAHDLTVVADPHPCPGYLHADRVIGFCPPAVETAIDRTRWMFFARMMGCTSVDDAAAFYDVALPLIVFHEASHHLRMTRGVASPSHFLEEQVCDRIAIAMVEASPAYRHTLAPLREICARMIERLGENYQSSPGAAFVPDIGALLVETHELDAGELARLDRLAEQHEMPLDELLGMLGAPVGGAAAARERAREHVDTRYTENPAEYWHLGLTWVHSYLSRPAHPALADVLREHLLAVDDEERAPEIDAVLRAMLAVPSLRAAAAEGLFAVHGTQVVRELATSARTADDVLAVLAAALPRGGWDAADLGDLLDPAEPPSPNRAPLLARLAGKCGHALPTFDGVTSEALALELVVANRSGDPADVTALATDPDKTTALVEAWEAHGRRLDELPPAALEALATQAFDPRARRAFLRIAIHLDSAHPAAELAIRLALDELAETIGPATEEVAANLTAHAVLERLGIARATTAAWSALPSRGAPAWDQFLLLISRGASSSPPPELAHMAFEVRLRAAAARAELRGVESDPEVLTLAIALLERAEHLLRQAAALVEPAAPDGGGRALAAEVTRMAARAATIDSVLALAPARSLAGIAKVARDAMERGPVETVMREVLAHAVPTPLRDRVAHALSEMSLVRSPLAPDTLPPLARTALAPPEDAMLTIEKLIHLRTVPLFAGVSLEQLHQVASLAVEQAYEAGATIFAAGDPGDRLYVILTGHVAIERGAAETRVMLDRLGPAACFGETSLFDPGPRSSRARALTSCRLLTLSRAAITRLGRSDPQLYEGLLELLSTRLRATSAELARVTALARG